MIFKGVKYGEAGERLMRALGRAWHETEDEEEKAQLVNEAHVVHAFHENFPGLTVHEVDA